MLIIGLLLVLFHTEPIINVATEDMLPRPAQIEVTLTAA